MNVHRHDRYIKCSNLSMHDFDIVSWFESVGEKRLGFHRTARESRLLMTYWERVRDRVCHHLAFGRSVDDTFEYCVYVNSTPFPFQEKDIERRIYAYWCSHFSEDEIMPFVSDRVARMVIRYAV